MSPRRLSFGLLVAAAAAAAGGACTVPPAAPTCTMNWVGPDGGDAATPANWDLGRAPTTTDWLCAPVGSRAVVTSPVIVNGGRLLGTVAVGPTGRFEVRTNTSDVGTLELAGELAGAGSARIGRLVWTGGLMTGTGVSTVTGGPASDITGAVALRGGRVLTLGSTTAIDATSVSICEDADLVVAGPVSLTEPATATVIDGNPCVASTSSVVIAADGALAVGAPLTVSMPLTVNGSLSLTAAVTAGVTTVTAGDASTFDLGPTGAILRMGATGTGTLNQPGGRFIGAGRLNGSLTGAPTIEPGVDGTAVGTLTVSRTVDLGPGGKLLAQVGGTAAGTSDRLVGGPTVDGRDLTVEVSTTGGFTPAAGDVVSLATATVTLQGPVAASSLPPVPGVYLQAAASSLNLRVSSCSSPLGPLADLTGSTVSSLRGCDLTAANLTGLQAAGADLTGAVLRDAGAEGANLAGADLTNADLTGLRLTSATLTGAIFANTTCPDGGSSTSFPSCTNHLVGRTFSVTATTDGVDATPGDGVCATSGGTCTLRAAIQETNALPSHDIISLSGSRTYTLTVAGAGDDAGAAGDLDVSGSLSIRYTGTAANAPRINAAGLERVIDVHGVAFVQIFGVRLDGGDGNGGVRNDGANLEISGTTITATAGPGLTSSGTARVVASWLDGNGRGVVVSAGRTVLDRTTVSRSTTGPGIEGSGASAVGLQGSTVSTNSGGGIVLAAPAVADLTDSTVAKNTGAGIVGPVGAVTMLNSVVADQTGAACANAVTSAGWNLDDDGSCGLTGTDDLSTTPSGLELLGENGGLARTHLPRMGSAVLDSGRPGCAAVDARGQARPADADGNGTSTCDRGAVETPTFRPLTMVVNALGSGGDATPGDGVCSTTTAGQCTLIAAVGEANSSFGPDTVTIPAGWSVGFGSTVTATTPITIISTGAGTSMTGSSGLVLRGGHDVTVQGIDVSVTLHNETGTLLVEGGSAASVVNGGVFTARNTRLDATTTVSGAGTTLIERSVVRGAITTTGPVRVVRSTVVGKVTTGTAPLRLRSSIVAVSAGVACGNAAISEGWNLAVDTSCGIAEPTDEVSTATWLVADRIDSAGRSFTEPIDGSVAIDRGEPGCGLDLVGRSAADGDGDGSVVCDRGAVEALRHRVLTLTVNSTLTTNDANRGDGVCATTVAGQCTLAAAVQESSAVPGSDVIQLQVLASYGSVGGTVDGGLEIRGANSFVSSNITTRSGRPLVLKDIRLSGTIQSAKADLTITNAKLGYGAAETVLTTGANLLVDRSSGRATLTNTGIATIQDSGMIGKLTNGGTLTLRRSTVTGVGVLALVTSTATTLDGATVAATSGPGLRTMGGTTTVLDSTLVGGSAVGLSSEGGTTTVTNSIVETRGSATACVGVILTGGWNYSNDDACSFGDATDLIADGAPPIVGPIQPRSTSGVVFGLPQAGSPVIDSGRTGCSGVDASGRPRVGDGDGDGTARCDRGATELGVRSDLDLTVTSSSDGYDANPGDGVCATTAPVACTLRAAVMESNATNGSDVIHLVPWVAHDLWATGAGGLDLAGPVVLDGQGATIGLTTESLPDTVIVPWGTSPVRVEDLTVRYHTPAVDNRWSTLELDQVSTLEGEITNAADLQITASHLWRVGSTGTLTLADSTSDAEVDVSGGTATIQRSTLDTLRVLTGASATVDRVSSDGVLRVMGGTASVTSSTLLGIDGIVVTSGGSATIANSVVTDCSGAVTSLGWNLLVGGACGTAAPTDLPGSRNDLTAEAVFGNGIRTRLLLADSVAVDSGMPGCSAVDARGSAAPIDGDDDGTAVCDRGATELGPRVDTVFTVTTTTDGNDADLGDGVCASSAGGLCSLSAAFQQARTTNGPDTVVLASGATYPVTGMGIPGGVTLEGNGATWFRPSGPQPQVGIDATRMGDVVVRNLTTSGVGWGTGGMVTFEHVTIRDGNGNVLTNVGDLHLDHVAIRDNIAPLGSAWNARNQGRLTVSDSTFSANACALLSEGELVVERSTFTASGKGCPEGAGAVVTSGTTTILTSTLSANTGSAVVITGGTTTITDTTFVDNGGASVLRSGGAVTISGSILAKTAGIPACWGTIVSGGYNLVGDGWCAFTQPTDVVSTAMLLGPLADNGGPTLTNLPGAGSPAIGTGRPDCGGTDQRGVARPTSGACARGAVEV